MLVHMLGEYQQRQAVRLQLQQSQEPFPILAKTIAKGCNELMVTAIPACGQLSFLPSLLRDGSPERIFMEPLNDILGRVTPRRQSTPSSRTAQPSQPPTRQQSPEQIARLRQKHSYGSQQQPSDYAAVDPCRPQDGSVTSRQPGRSAGQNYREPDRYQASLSPRSENRLPGHRQTQQQTGRMLPQAQQELPSTQPLLPSAASKTGSYHRADDSTSNYYGDVID